jgi:hypothetical protein
MFTVSQRPPSSSLWNDPIPPSTHRLAALRGTDDRMDVDVDVHGDGADHADLGVGSSLGVRRSVVSPGETITSSKEYMR